MNVALLAHFFVVLFLVELMVTSVDAIFFSSFLSTKAKTNLPTPVKYNDDNLEDHAYGDQQQTKQKPHIIVILADDMVS